MEIMSILSSTCIGIIILFLSLKNVQGKSFTPPDINSAIIYCSRESKMTPIGFDLERNHLKADVGHCKKIVRNPIDGNSKDIYKSFDKDYTKFCGEDSMCEPTKILVNNYYVIGGQKEQEVIEDCHCRPRPSTCQRLEMKKVYYPNSPYQVVVDVGKCAGHCKKGTRCRSIRNDTLVINGPNGKECVEVTRECGCSKGCYRVSHKAVFYENLVDHDDGGLYKLHMKEVDIGRCVSASSPSGSSCNAQKRCVLRQGRRENNQRCLMSLSSSTSCLPTSYIQHTFLDRDFNKKTVLSIQKCSCA